MAPARAVQLIRPQGASHDAKDREVLPRPGIALICGFFVDRLLSPWLAPLFGLPGSVAAVHEAAGGQAPGTVAISAFARRPSSWRAVFAGLVPRPADQQDTGRLSTGFNRIFARVIEAYGRNVATVSVQRRRPRGLRWLDRPHRPGLQDGAIELIPAQDKGYLVVDVQLPSGASLERTDAVVRRASDIILDVPGAAHAVGFAGFSAATPVEQLQCRCDLCTVEAV